MPQITTDGPTAATWASEGKLVIAGLKSEDHQPLRSHGHVVVIVAGPLARDQYPSAYWDTLGSTGRKNQTLNWAWNSRDRDHLTYAVINLVTA